MDHRLAARHVPARQDELADLHAEAAFDPHGRRRRRSGWRRCRAGRRYDVPRVAVVAQEGDAAVVVRVDDVQVAVPAQVPEGRPEAHALFVEAPGRADVFELQVAQVAEGEVRLGRGGLAYMIRILSVGRLGAHQRACDVGVRVPRECHSSRRGRGGRRCPGPRGAPTRSSRSPRLPRGRRASRKRPVPVFRERVPRGTCGAAAESGLSSVAAARVGDRVLVPLVGGRGHVGDEEIDEAVVVHVARSAPIEENERVRQHAVDDVGERPVPVVVVELVGDAVVVGDVEVRPAVVVEVPPRRGVALRLAA